MTLHHAYVQRRSAPRSARTTYGLTRPSRGGSVRARRSPATFGARRTGSADDVFHFVRIRVRSTETSTMSCCGRRCSHIRFGSRTAHHPICRCGDNRLRVQIRRARGIFRALGLPRLLGTDMRPVAGITAIPARADLAAWTSGSLVDGPAPGTRDRDSVEGTAVSHQ